MSLPPITRPKRWDMPFSQEGGHDADISDEDVEELLQLESFRNIDEKGFKKSVPLRDILRNDVRIQTYRAGDVIVRHGDWGSSAFLIMSGAAAVELDRGDGGVVKRQTKKKRRSLFQSFAQLWQNNRHREVRDREAAGQSNLRSEDGVTRLYLSDVSAVLEDSKSATLEAGQWFGELAALGRTPRAATVIATDRSRLVEIRWQGLRDIMRFDRNGALKGQIDNVFRERALTSFLKTEPLFADLGSDDLRQLVSECELVTFGEYDTATPFRDLKSTDDSISDEPIIAEEGERASAVFLIRSGTARISRSHFHGRKTVGYLNPGRAFGLSEVIWGGKGDSQPKYEYRLSAIGYLNAVLIPATVIEALANRKVISGPSGSAAGEYSESPVQEHLLNFLVDQHYVQGTATMVIDLDRCTRCDDCVQACAVAHDNNPRFIRHGPVSGRHMIANACMHCADPVCMIECPTGAIHRDTNDGLVLINESTCIGCAQCANNCPFDAIRMVEVSTPSGGVIVDAKGTPIMEATKCDLCQDQHGGPACQHACPHDALERVDLQNLFDQGVISR
ncbi:MAG TPA: hypothetical protein DCG12_02315 [Planctomycetaceae bacterium]|nr:hypothetical protein [Planctomycetaceae bacterium]